MKINTAYLQAVIHDFLVRLRDIRFAGQVLFVIIVLLISWSGVKTIQANYDLQKQIATAKQENNIQQLENATLKLENQYYQSNQYLNLQARQDYGLAAPGEQEILVPKSVAMYYAPKVTLPATGPVKSYQPTYQKDMQDWVNYFLHRN